MFGAIHKLMDEKILQRVVEASADDVLKPHSPETLAYREEAKREKKAQFTRIYPDRSKVKQAGPIRGLSSGKELPVSQKLTGTVYYNINMGEEVIITITIDVDKPTITGVLDYFGNQRESLSLNYVMGIDLESYEEFIAEWAPVSTNEANADDILRPHSEDVQQQKKEEQKKRLAEIANKYFPHLKEELLTWLKDKVVPMPTPDDPETMDDVFLDAMYNKAWRLLPLAPEGMDDAEHELYDEAFYFTVEDVQTIYYNKLHEDKADDVLKPHSPEVIRAKEFKWHKKLDAIEAEYLPNVRDLAIKYVESGEFADDVAGREDAGEIGISFTVLSDEVWRLAGDLRTFDYEIADIVYDAKDRIVNDVWKKYVKKDTADESKADDVLQPHSPEVKKEKLEQLRKRYAELEQKYLPDFRRDLVAYAKSPDYMDDCLEYRERRGENRWRVLQNKADSLIDYEKMYLLSRRTFDIDDVITYITQHVFDKYVIGVPRTESKVQETTADDILKPFTDEELEQRDEARIDREMDAAMAASADAMPEVAKVVTSEEFLVELFSYDEVPGDVTNWLHDRVDYITGGRPQNIDQGSWDDEVAYFIANLMDEFAIDLSKGLKKQFNIVDEALDSKGGIRLRRELPKHEIEDVLTNDVADQLLRAMSSGEYFQLLFDADYLEDPLRTVLIDKTDIPDEIDDTHWFWEGHMESEVEGFVPHFIEAVEQALGPTKYQGEEQPSFDFTEAMADDLLQPHPPEVQQQKKAERTKNLSDKVYKIYGVRPGDKVKQIAPINRAIYHGMEGMTGTVELIPHADLPEIQVQLDKPYRGTLATEVFMESNPIMYPILVGQGRYYYVDQFQKEWAPVDVREDKADDILKPHTPEVKQRKEKERFERIAQDIDRVFPNVDLAQKMLNYVNSIASWADYRRIEGPLTTIFIDKSVKIVGGSKKWKALRGKQENFSEILWSLIEYLIDVFDKRHTDSTGEYRIGEAKADDVLKPHSPEVKQQKLEIGFREIVGYASSAVLKFIQSQFADVKDGIKWFEADGPPYTMIGKYTDSYIAYHESPVIVSFDEVYDMVWRAVKLKAGLVEAKDADDILQPHPPEVKQQKKEIGLQAARDWSKDSKAGYPKLRKTFEEFAKQHKREYKTVGQLQSVLYKLGCDLLPDSELFLELGLMYSLGSIGKSAYDVANSFDLPMYRTTESNADDILQPFSKDEQHVKYLNQKKRQEAIVKKYFPNIVRDLERYMLDKSGLHHDWRNSLKPLAILMHNKAVELSKPTPQGLSAEEKTEYMDVLFDISAEAYNAVSSYTQRGGIQRGGIITINLGGVIHTVGESKADDILQPHTPKEKQRIADIQLEREHEWHKAHNGKYVRQIDDIDRAGLFTVAADRELTGVIGFELGRVPYGGYIMFVQVDEELEELNEWQNRLYYFDDEYDMFQEEWEIR